MKIWGFRKRHNTGCERLINKRLVEPSNNAIPVKSVSSLASQQTIKTDTTTNTSLKKTNIKPILGNSGQCLVNLKSLKPPNE